MTSTSNKKLILTGVEKKENLMKEGSLELNGLVVL
jgi:hypothetical protein